MDLKKFKYFFSFLETIHLRAINEHQYLQSSFNSPIHKFGIKFSFFIRLKIISSYSKELYLESDYFVSRNNCLKVHFEHCHIWPYLGIRTVRFNWSMMEKYDHVFPVLPKGSIHAINHIGWLRSANQEVDLYSTVKNLKGIVDLSLYFE